MSNLEEELDEGYWDDRNWDDEEDPEPESGPVSDRSYYDFDSDDRDDDPASAFEPDADPQDWMSPRYYFTALKFVYQANNMTVKSKDLERIMRERFYDDTGRIRASIVTRLVRVHPVPKPVDHEERLERRATDLENRKVNQHKRQAIISKARRVARAEITLRRPFFATNADNEMWQRVWDETWLPNLTDPAHPRKPNKKESKPRRKHRDRRPGLRAELQREFREDEMFRLYLKVPAQLNLNENLELDDDLEAELAYNERFPLPPPPPKQPEVWLFI